MLQMSLTHLAFRSHNKRDRPMFTTSHPFLISSAIVLFTSSHAFAAAPTAELKVTGKLEVPGCTLTVEDEGAYDFGTISPVMVKTGTAQTALTPLAKIWNVACTGKTYLTYTVIDNRAASASDVDTGRFGLGNINETGKLGYYDVTMSKATVDEKASSVFSTNTKAITSSSSTFIHTGYTMGWSSGTTLQAGQNFAALFQVQPVLAGTTTMNGPITDNANLDGSLTMNFAFGL